MTLKRANPLIAHSNSFVFILLLCSGINAIPLHVSETLSFPQANTYKSLVMPVWARKAGGHWKPELLQEIAKESTLNSKEFGSEKDTVDSQSVFSSGAKRTGVDSAHVEDEEKNEGQDEPDQEDEYVYDDWEAEEPECADGMFYHVRGKRCVPERCPGGNSWRDRDTGECILKHYRNPYRNRWRSSRPWRPQ